ncbi:hypothetical protein NSS91_16160 [Caldifermentibacillus hisashii]|uniref:hypothetical protein n=1 Tax=Caldifermentibacillus hisashii TaxID=996558 RepID=UPI0031FD1650
MTEQERLENMSPIDFDLNGNVLLKGKDYHWLMEQAERVEELEEKVKQYEKALAGFNKEFNFEYRWQKSNVKRNPKSQWQRGALEGFEHVKRIYDKHVEVRHD